MNALDAPLGGGKAHGRGKLAPDVDDMLHRATFQTSPQKSGAAGIGTEEELDNVAIAANAREVQYQTMLDSTHMQQITREILDLHREMGSLASDLAFHEDKSLQGRLEFANQTYVRLFERMLAETLMLQRSKFKSQTKTIQELKALLAELRVNEQNAREAGVRDRNAAQRSEIEMANLTRQIQLLNQQLDELNVAKLMLEDSNRNLLQKLEQYQGGVSERDRAIIANQARSEARAAFMKELALLRKQWEKEAKDREEELRKQVGRGTTLLHTRPAAKNRHLECIIKTIVQMADMIWFIYYYMSLLCLSLCYAVTSVRLERALTNPRPHAPRFCRCKV